MLRKYIFLATVQSTGTWWTIKALKSHPEIGNMIHPQNLMRFHNGWALDGGWTGNPHNEGFAPEGQVTMLYSHYGGTPANFDRWNTVLLTKILLKNIVFGYDKKKRAPLDFRSLEDV